jgi:UDP-N-acetyl-D-mannosaminuronic acid dehydrogenase
MYSQVRRAGCRALSAHREGPAVRHRLPDRRGRQDRRERVPGCQHRFRQRSSPRGLVNNLPNEPANPLTNPVRTMHMPGAGVGGHCLPKDSWLLKYGVDHYGTKPVQMRVILGSRETNDAMPRHMADLAIGGLKGAGVDPSRARVVILGYAFLENSDDTRNTPALPLIVALRNLGVVDIRVHDPFVREEELPGVVRDVASALAGADCACLVTSHAVYQSLEPETVRSAMRNCLIIDGRNAFARFRGEPGFKVLTVGRG